MTTRRGAFLGDVVGGLNGALTVIPTLLSYGVVIFQPLGPAAAAIGIQAAFVSGIVAAIVAGWLGSMPLHLSSPKTGTAVILAALVVQLAGLREFDELAVRAGLPAPALLIIFAFMTAMLAGMLQLGFGLTRLGRIVKFIPFPVVAGVLDGLSILTILPQIPRLLGLPPDLHMAALLTGAARPNLAGLVLGLAAGAVVLVPAARRLPMALVALAAGTLLYHMIRSMAPGINLGSVIGDLPSGLPFSWPEGSAAGLLQPSLQMRALLFPVAGTALAIAVLSSIQSLLSAGAVEGLSGRRTDPDRELLAQGVANLLAGLAGGMPAAGSVSQTQMVYRAGGRGRLASLVNGLALLAAIAAGGRIIALIPNTVMAGVVIAVTLSVTDEWTRYLIRRFAATRDHRKDVTLNLAIVVLVAGIVVAVGTLSGLAAGIVVTLVMFFNRSGSKVVRRAYRGNHVHSKTGRGEMVMQSLERHGAEILVVELQGPVFFGSADQIARQVDATEAGFSCLIIDFRRVPDIDTSGAVALRRMDERLARAGKQLLLATPVGDDLRLFLADIGYDGPEREGRIFASVDRALAYAEDRLLEKLGLAPPPSRELPLEELDAIRGLPAEEIEVLATLLQRREYPAGTLVIAENEAADSLFLLARGRVSVLRRVDGGDQKAQGQSTRLAHLSPGVVFGEMGLIRNEARSADLVADEIVVCHELPGAAYRQLCRERPGMALHLVQNIAVQLADRVARLNDSLVELDR